MQVRSSHTSPGPVLAFSSAILSTLCIDPVDLLLKQPTDVFDTATFATSQDVQSAWATVVIDGLRAGALVGSVLQVS